MIGEVAAVLSALKALNDGINTIKQSAGNASDLQSIVGRFAGAQEKYNEVEKAKTVQDRVELVMRYIQLQLTSSDNLQVM